MITSADAWISRAGQTTRSEAGDRGAASAEFDFIIAVAGDSVEEVRRALEQGKIDRARKIECGQIWRGLSTSMVGVSTLRAKLIPPFVSESGAIRSSSISLRPTWLNSVASSFG